MDKYCQKIGHGPIDYASVEPCLVSECAACEIAKLSSHRGRLISAIRHLIQGESTVTILANIEDIVLANPCFSLQSDAD
jgi:hypothetical protein